MKTLLQDTRVGNIAVAIGLAVAMLETVRFRRKDVELWDTRITNFVGRVNDKQIIDMDLVKEVMLRTIKQKVYSFSVVAGDIVLNNDYLTESMLEAMKDKPDIITLGRNFGRSVINEARKDLGNNDPFNMGVMRN